MGLYLGLDLVRDRATREPAREEAFAICERLRERGAIVQPTGDGENVLKLKPPLVFEQRDADWLRRDAGRRARARLVARARFVTGSPACQTASVPARASDELYVRLPPEEVREHVHLWLLAPERELPEVVITTRHGRTLVEPGALARRLGGRAQVVLVETGEATYALRDVLGDELAVWGGAARVYHPGFMLSDRASLHPRIYAFEGRESEAERALLAALGIEDARADDRFAIGEDVEGEVVSLDARTATLALADGCARVRAGDLARGFVHSCHDVLRIGQRVRGRVRELAPDGTPWLDLQPFQADEIATIAEQAGPGRHRARARAAGAATTASRWSCCRARTHSCRCRTARPSSRPSATTCSPRASCGSTWPTGESSSRSPMPRRAPKARGRCGSTPTARSSWPPMTSPPSARPASSTAARRS